MAQHTETEEQVGKRLRLDEFSELQEALRRYVVDNAPITGEIVPQCVEGTSSEVRIKDVMSLHILLKLESIYAISIPANERMGIYNRIREAYVLGSERKAINVAGNLLGLLYTPAMIPVDLGALRAAATAYEQNVQSKCRLEKLDDMKQAYIAVLRWLYSVDRFEVKATLIT